MSVFLSLRTGSYREVPNCQSRVCPVATAASGSDKSQDRQEGLFYYQDSKGAPVSCLAEQRAVCRRRQTGAARFEAEALADRRAMRAGVLELEY